jgi:hypothetical protein
MRRYHPQAAGEQARLGQGERLAGEVADGLRDLLGRLQQAQGEGPGEQQAEWLGEAQRRLELRAALYPLD